MSLLSDLDKLSKIQDKLKKNEKNAELNHKRANLAAQMKPTDKNKNQAQKAKDVYKDINNAIDDVKDLRKDMNKGKGAVHVLVFLAGLIGAIIGFFKWNG